MKSHSVTDRLAWYKGSVTTTSSKVTNGEAHIAHRGNRPAFSSDGNNYTGSYYYPVPEQEYSVLIPVVYVYRYACSVGYPVYCMLCSNAARRSKC